MSTDRSPFDSTSSVFLAPQLNPFVFGWTPRTVFFFFFQFCFYYLLVSVWFLSFLRLLLLAWYENGFAFCRSRLFLKIACFFMNHNVTKALCCILHLGFYTRLPNFHGLKKSKHSSVSTRLLKLCIQV